MQAAELRDQLVAGPKVQVVGVAEQDRRAELSHLVGIERLHGRLRPDRHERRRRDGAVGRSQLARASRTLSRRDGERVVHRCSCCGRF
jgi:hypothetical protein